MGKLRPSGEGQLAQYHSGSLWQNKDKNPDLRIVYPNPLPSPGPLSSALSSTYLSLLMEGADGQGGMGAVRSISLSSSSRLFSNSSPREVVGRPAWSSLVTQGCLRTSKATEPEYRSTIQTEYYAAVKSDACEDNVAIHEKARDITLNKKWRM